MLLPQKSGLFNGKVVFATPDIRFALAMIHGTGEEIAVGYYNSRKIEKKQMYIDELQPDSLQLFQQSGCLYLVAAAGFVPDKRLAHSEYINRNPVRVLEKFRITNILDELAKYDVNIVEYDDVPASMQARR